MSATVLHVFAVNGENDVRHTNLTRAQGETPDLPPIAAWLGLAALDTDRIELFPVSDLGDTALSDYVTMAFDPEPPMDAATRSRLDALEGSVMLVPGDATQADARPGAAVTAIATVTLAQADHAAELPKSEVAAAPQRPPEPEPETRKPRKHLSQGVKFAIFVLIFIGLYVLLEG